MKENIERREISGNVELRQLGNGHTIAGRVAYNSRSEDLGFYEYLMPGCFAESLKTDEVLCYFGHDNNQILGRQSNNSLRLTDTPNALNWICDLPDTQLGADTASLVADKYLTSNSFGFIIPKDGDKWRENAQGDIERRVHRATLLEVSPVSVPAYKANQVTLVRSMPKWVREKLDSKRDGIAGPDKTIINGVATFARTACNGGSDGHEVRLACRTCAQDVVSKRCGCDDDTDSIWTCSTCGGWYESSDDADDVVAAQNVESSRALLLTLLNRRISR